MSIILYYSNAAFYMHKIGKTLKPSLLNKSGKDHSPPLYFQIYHVTMLRVDSALEKGAQQVGRIKAFLFIQHCASVGCTVAIRQGGLTWCIYISFSKSTEHTWQNGKTETDHQQTSVSPWMVLDITETVCSGVTQHLHLYVLLALLQPSWHSFPSKHRSVSQHSVVGYPQMISPYISSV